MKIGKYLFVCTIFSGVLGVGFYFPAKEFLGSYAIIAVVFLSPFIFVATVFFGNICEIFSRKKNETKANSNLKKEKGGKKIEKDIQMSYFD